MEAPQIASIESTGERFEVHQLDAEEFATLLDASETFQKDDTGDLAISNCIHPERGHIVLVEGISGSYLCVRPLLDAVA